MKTNEKTNEALARRWMASKHWGGWRAGMRCQITGRVCLGATPSGNAVWHFDPGVRDGVGGGLPDLDHPGTRAFLLEDVRKAWKDSVYWMSGPGGHHVIKCGYQWFNAALEAAP